MRQMLGKSIADRYIDFCRVASGAIPLRVSVPVAGHAIRELDSVLRQTLAGPMGVALVATAEDKARLKAARKQLRALGFTDDAVNRAVEKLQPRRSHKEEIQAIVTRLGLGAEGDIARAWISMCRMMAGSSRMRIGIIRTGRRPSIRADAGTIAPWLDIAPLPDSTAGTFGITLSSVIPPLGVLRPIEC